MNFSQSNTKTGPFQVLTAIDFTGFEGRACELSNVAGVTYAIAPAALINFANFIVVNVISWNATTSIGVIEIQPLTPATEARVVVDANIGTCVAGTKIVVYGGAVAGKAMQYAGSGAAFDGIRPLFQ